MDTGAITTTGVPPREVVTDSSSDDAGSGSSGSDGFESVDSADGDAGGPRSPAPEPAPADGKDGLQNETVGDSQSLEYRRRFRSLRPHFQGLFARFSKGRAGVEPATLDGLARTLFPDSVGLQTTSADALVEWPAFIGFIEDARHVPAYHDSWEVLSEKLAMLEADAQPVDCDLSGAVRSDLRKKAHYDFPVQHAQRLGGSQGGDDGGEMGAAWVLEMAHDGKYMASGGQDGIVRVWRASSQSDEAEADHLTGGSDNSTCRTVATASARRVFDVDPMCALIAHGHGILDLAWSRKSLFLLSASMDNTVRLWHPLTTDNCIRTYPHKDFVTSVHFHPSDETLFVSGSLDCCARVWHIPSHGVAAAVDLPECITSAVFSPDGCLAAFGSFGGHLYFFRAGVTGESDSIGVDLEQIMQLQVAKTSRGDDPCKITAIKFRPGSDLSDVYEVLLTTNDSRIRLYKLDKTGGASAITRSLKISGHRNISSRFGATFSADGQYVMCGSEDSSVYIWAVTTDPDSKHPDVQHRWERFAVAGVTAAIWGWGPDPGFITASNQGAIDCFVVSR